jgi:hypothetical protein
MAIERNLIFANGNAYDIAATAQYIRDVYNRFNNENIFPESRLAECIAVLEDMRFLVEIDADEMMPDIYTGVLTVWPLWMRDHGVFDHRLSDLLLDAASIETISISDDPAWDDEQDIDSEEEAEMIIGAHVLAEMYAEDQFDDMDYSDSDNDSDKENVARDVME